MTRGMVVTLVGLGVLIGAGLIGNYFYQAHLDEEDEQIEAENERHRFFPDSLKCAPTFEHFETALQHSLNATTVRALVYLDRKDKRKVHLDTDLDGGSKCDADLLRKTYRDPRVGRLLKHCGVNYLDCVRSDAALELTW